MPGYTALFYLVDRAGPPTQDKALIVAQWLIKTAGADPNIPRNNGVTPLAVANVKGLTALAAYLQEHGAH